MDYTQEGYAILLAEVFKLVKGNKGLLNEILIDYFDGYTTLELVDFLKHNGYYDER